VNRAVRSSRRLPDQVEQRVPLFRFGLIPPDLLSSFLSLSRTRSCAHKTGCFGETLRRRDAAQRMTWTESTTACSSSHRDHRASPPMASLTVGDLWHALSPPFSVSVTQYAATCMSSAVARRFAHASRSSGKRRERAGVCGLQTKDVPRGALQRS